LAPPKPAPVTRPDPEPPLPKDDNRRTQRIIGFAALGLGGTSAVASAVVGGLFLSKLDEFEDNGRTDDALRDETVTLQAWTSGTAIAGGVLSAVGLVLVLTALGDEPEGAQLSPTAQGVRLRF
jgi:hypothetical protein